MIVRAQVRTEGRAFDDLTINLSMCSQYVLKFLQQLLIREAARESGESLLSAIKKFLRNDCSKCTRARCPLFWGHSLQPREQLRRVSAPDLSATIKRVFQQVRDMMWRPPCTIEKRDGVPIEASGDVIDIAAFVNEFVKYALYGCDLVR